MKGFTLMRLEHVDCDVKSQSLGLKGKPEFTMKIFIHHNQEIDGAIFDL